ncbi:acetylcholine receptor subunit beta-like 1 [Octopus sinensis]|uniref:Acetylcholine receptor subunit beta-like 1 n=1 Tax=Octopus sinensis TaxID=2607531 RepID=A0A7E6EII2_9MOLL|nr:acetylcholine receptor subunit beta-like 1 [Octopus sinensis]
MAYYTFCHEHRLLYDLFEKQRYNPLVRPVSNHSTPLFVQFSLAFQQLINIVNTADGNYEPSFMSNVVIYNTGLILWVPPAIYKSSCTIDVSFFPFDQQICEMKFGSWTYNPDELDFLDVNADLNDYRISQVWDIIDYETITKRINSDLGKHVEVVFRFVIRRKSLFYSSNLIIPCVLIALLSVTVFYLPADAGEKITLSISILFSINVFLLLVSKILPPSSTIPLISTYLLFTFILNIFTIFVTVILINWNFRTPRTHRMSKWFKIIFLKYLPRILLMERPDHTKRYQSAMERNNNYKQLDKQNFVSYSPKSFETQESEKSPPLESSPFFPADLVRRDSTAEDALNSINFIAHHLYEQDEYNAVREDWKYIASVFDRLQLYIFLLVTAIGSIATLMNAPYVFDFVDQKEIINTIIKRKNT